MITLDIRSELPKAIRWTDGLVKQLPFAVSQSLNKVGFDARTAYKGSSRQYFDRPTSFIQNAWRVDKSSKRNLVVTVYPEAKREPYLRTNITGGRRGTKPFEAKYLGKASVKLPPGTKLIPAVVRLNGQGNVSLPTLKRISQQIGKTGRNSVFVGTPKGGGRSPGVYQRQANGNLVPIFIAAPSAKYRPIFPIVDIGMKIVERRFSGYLLSSLERALTTAR